MYRCACLCRIARVITLQLTCFHCGMRSRTQPNTSRTSCGNWQQNSCGQTSGRNWRNTGTSQMPSSELLSTSTLVRQLCAQETGTSWLAQETCMADILSSGRFFGTGFLHSFLRYKNLVQVDLKKTGTSDMLSCVVSCASLVLEQISWGWSMCPGY